MHKKERVGADNGPSLSFGKSTGQASGPKDKRGRRRSEASEPRLQNGLKRSGTAHANSPKMHQKRKCLGAENGRSESGKKKPWQSFGRATDQGHSAKRQAWESTKTKPQTNPSKQGNAVARRLGRAQANATGLFGQGFGPCFGNAMASCGNCLLVAHPSQAPAPAWHETDIMSPVNTWTSLSLRARRGKR